MKHLVLPPLGLFLLVAAGLLVARRRRRAGRAIAWTGAVLLVLSSVPFASAALLISLQVHPALPPSGPLPDAGAIVILGGDVAPRAPELGRAVPGRLSRERLAYGAALARRTGLPVLACGGNVQAGVPPLSEVLSRSLAEDHGVEARWIERRSTDTFGNAREAAELLAEEGIARVLLVTHAWHMPRAVSAFEAAGLDVVPAPTAFRVWPPLALGSFLPSARSILETHWATHEWLGRAWYALRR